MIALIHDTVRRDWAGLARLGLAYVLARHLRMNPLRPPKACPVEQWLQNFAKAFCQAFGLKGASWAFLVEVLILAHQECKERGVALTLRRAYTAIVNYPAKGEQKLYQTRIISKWHAILLAYPHQLDWEVGFDSLDFIEAGRSVIWERPDEDDIRNFFILLDMYRIFVVRSPSPEFRRERLAIVLDEALSVLEHELAGKIVSQGRALNLSLINLSQNPSLANPIVTSNAGVIASFRNQAQELEATQELMNLTKLQAAELVSLPVGRCALRVPGPRLPAPLLVNVARYDVSAVTDQELEEISKRSIEPFVERTVPVQETPAAEPRGQAQHDPTGLSRDAIACLRSIYERTQFNQMRCDEKGWTESRDRDLRRKLKSAGLIQKAEGSVGNKRGVWIPTPRAEAVATRRGWKRDKFKSGPLHEASRKAVKLGIVRSIGKQVRVFDKGYGSLFAGREPDITLRFQSGDFVLIQLLHANNVEREGNVLLELTKLELGHVGFVIAICLKSEKRKRLERCVVKQCGGSVPPSLEIMDLEPTLAVGFDWGWILERPC